MRAFVGVLAAVVLLVSSCAKSTSTAEVAVESHPTASEIWVDGVKAGETPTTLSLEKSTSHQIIISKDGFESQSVAVNTKATNTDLILATAKNWFTVPEQPAQKTVLDTDSISVTLEEKK